MSKDQISVHAKEENNEGKEYNIGGDAKFTDMLETPPTASFLEDVGTSSW
jgi:hypothetical protein